MKKDYSFYIKYGKGAGAVRSDLKAGSFHDAVRAAYEDIRRHIPVHLKDDEIIAALEELFLTGTYKSRTDFGKFHILLLGAPARALAVTIVEATSDGEYFPVTVSGGDAHSVMPKIRAYFKTESHERDLTFDIDWKDLEEDIRYGNQLDGPYIIGADGYDSDWVVTSEIIEI